MIDHPAANAVEPLDDVRTAAYLARVGVSRRSAPGGVELRDLQRRHLQSVPFENLTIHLNEPLSVDDLFDKVVTRRRGGLCYELNGLFAALLTSLG